MAPSKLSSATKLQALLQVMAEETHKEIPLNQMALLAYVAKAGQAGVDHGQAARDLETTPTTVTRNAFVLGSEPDGSGHVGYGLLTTRTNPANKRLRILTITPKGMQLVEKLIAAAR